MSQPGPIGKTNIQEANKHLRLLYDRIAELEQQLGTQAETYSKKELQLQTEIRDVILDRDAEINDFKETAVKKDRLIQTIQAQLSEKDKRIAMLENKCKVIREIEQYVPAMQAVVDLVKMVDRPTSPYSDSVNQQGSGHTFPGTPVRETDSPNDSGVRMDVGNHMENSRAGTFDHLAMRIPRGIDRHFSISEDDVDDEVFTFSVMKRERELYL